MTRMYTPHEIAMLALRVEEMELRDEDENDVAPLGNEVNQLIRELAFQEEVSILRACDLIRVELDRPPLGDWEPPGGRRKRWQRLLTCVRRVLPC